MEGTTSIQLEFRTGDDLFNNYNIGIIRQVVDKSETAIEQKKEEMRQLVGGKYLEMLRVSDTITDMSKEFGIIATTVREIQNICDSLDGDFVYRNVPDIETIDMLSKLLTPERLWELYDKNEMLKLAKELMLYDTSNCGRFSSLQSEMVSEFPTMCADKCMKLILDDSDKLTEKRIELFSSFCLFTKQTNRHSEVADDPFTYLSVFLEKARLSIAPLMSTNSLESLLQSISCVNTVLQVVLLLMTAESNYTIFGDCFPRVASGWRESQRPDIALVLRKWVDGEFAALEAKSSKMVEAAGSITALADMKRKVTSMRIAMQEEWRIAMNIISTEMSYDPLETLFVSLFQEQSRGLICSCIGGLREVLHIAVLQILQMPCDVVKNCLQKTVIDPITRLFTDLADLNYVASPELIVIVQNETQALFNGLLTDFNVINDDHTNTLLLLSYCLFMIAETSRDIETSCKIDMKESAAAMDQQSLQCAKKWVSSLLHSDELLQPYFDSLRWDLRDSEWYQSASGWKEFSLGSEEEEDVVLVPGSVSSALLSFLVELCKHLDLAESLSNNTKFISQSREAILSREYLDLATFYQKLVASLLSTHTSISSPGMLILLFDLRFLKGIIEGYEDIDGVIDSCRMLQEAQDSVLSEIDPVDWTLAESYMQISLDEYLSSISLLLSPLLPNTYQIKNDVSVKSLSRNSIIIFTPMEKIASYPIASQSMLLLLQAQIKGL